MTTELCPRCSQPGEPTRTRVALDRPMHYCHPCNLAWQPTAGPPPPDFPRSSADRAESAEAETETEPSS